MTTGNPRLRGVLREAGLSYAELARGVCAVAAENGTTLRTNSSAVAHWVAGTRPAGTTAAIVAEALSRRLGRPVTAAQLGLTPTSGGRDAGRGTDGDPGLGLRPDEDAVDALVALGRGDIDNRPWVRALPYSDAAAGLPFDTDRQTAAASAAARGTGTAGGNEVRAVQEMTTLFTAVDERHGGRHGRSALVQYLTSDVAALCRARFPNGEQHARMLSAAACVAYLAGWKAYDAREQGLAQRYYLQAYRLTREAGNDLHGAFVLRVLAHHGMESGRHEHALTLIDAALQRVHGRTDPATESLYVVTRARALALSGRGREAVAEAARAARLVDGADEDEMPYWAALWGSARACVGAHTAKSAEAMGDFAVAEEHFNGAVWDSAGAGYQRIRALSAAHTGTMQCRQGRVEQACGTWDGALDLMRGVRSARVLRAVTGMRQDLAPYRRRGVPAAADLEERLRVWSTEHRG